MNYWRIIWRAYFVTSSRRKFAIELFKISPAWMVGSLAVISIIFISSFIILTSSNKHSNADYVAMIVSELLIFLILDRMKEKYFYTAYGSTLEGIAPAENEN